jgi:hypothetical protein
LRAVGLLFSLGGMVMGLLAIIFSLHSMLLLLAIIIFLLGARLFALWLQDRPVPSPTTPISSKQLPPTPYRQNDALAPSRRSDRATSYANSDLGATVVPHVGLHHQEYDDDATAMQDVQPVVTRTGPLTDEPLEQDALFALDQPALNERCFLLPKEGEPLIECQDCYALAYAHGYRSYAVTDGVASSFVPRPWARIIARAFVERAIVFATKNEFQYWLAACSREWHTWIEQRWVPTINALRQRNGDRPRDWSQEIRQGAQTTLLGCVLSPSQLVEGQPCTIVSVFAIGDSELFHFVPNGGGLAIRHTFPYQQSADFDAYPATLLSVARPDLVERAWKSHKAATISASPGDLLVLATDTLAKWLLAQIEQGTDHWQGLLATMTPEDFEDYIRREFQRDHVEDDDVTMLLIPL